MRNIPQLRAGLAGLALLYLSLLGGFTAGFGNDVPAGAWVGFGIVIAIVVAVDVAAVALLEHEDARRGRRGGRR